MSATTQASPNHAADAGSGAIDRTPCSCGAGLRRVRCCGLDPAGLPDPANHAALDALAQKAREARTANHNREAERHALQILDLAPHHREALRLLFELRRAEGRAGAAEVLLRRLAGLEPQTAILHVQHAQMLINQSRHGEAEAPARAALKLAPRDATVHHILGIIYTETNRLQAGEHHYRLASGYGEPRDPALIGNLAWNMKQQGRLDEAAAFYDVALGIKRENARGLAGYAQVEAGRGRFDRAEALIAEAAALAPGDRMIGLLGALARLHRGDPAAALARLDANEAAIAPQSPVATETAAKGQALERLGRFEDAWAAYGAARLFQRERAGRRFDAAPIAARLAAVKSAFMADRLSALPRPAAIPGAPVPVFLLGVARSGTSLLEQMLVQMQGIDPADQRGPLAALARLLPALIEGFGGPAQRFPAALAETVAGDQRDILPLLAQRYIGGLRSAGAIAADTRLVTDRHAELPWLLGFANALFPDAAIIHVLRHPLDVVLSGFAQDKLHEGNAGVTLASLAQLYDAQMQAIAHIRGQATMRYLPVRYETLVHQPAATLGAVLDFIGVSADADALLAAPPRAVPRIPAHRVVQEPVHRRGLHRHAPFGAALAGADFDEAHRLLAPWIEQLGYLNAARIAA